MQEEFEFKMSRYRTPDGKPTCCSHYEKHFCVFQRTEKMGTIDTCVFAPYDYNGRLQACERDDSKEKGDGLGYTIPGKWCPIWKS